MRLQQYLNEEISSIEELNELIYKNCKPYLKLTKGKYMFKRGMKNNIDDYGVKNVRQNRKPRGMKEDRFVELNKGLDKNGHVRRDKAVIAINIKEGAVSQFGNVYGIFPIGKFDYTWLMAKDMNISDGNTGWNPVAVEEFFRFGEVKADTITGEFEDYFVTNSSIKFAGENRYEIWFNCKQYYYVRDHNFEWNKHTQTIRTRA